MKARLANALWVAACRPQWRRFEHQAADVAAAQSALLMRTLRANANTEYGLSRNLSAITSPARYQASVPLTDYDDYRPLVEQMAAGDSRVLTAEPVRLFELSSGSTAASKLVPYTRTLKAEFQRGIAAWIYDLYSHHPRLQRGTAYWSVTPLQAGPRYSPGGTPIGFESDSAYLGPLGSWLARYITAVPDSVKFIGDVDDFRYATLHALLRKPDLRLISVWNPTFLTLLLEPLADWWDMLLSDIERGSLTLPHLGRDAAASFPDPMRCRQLRGFAPTDFASIWPDLALISCWSDGPSAPYARRLAETFPSVPIQPKGLIATEAFVSFPLAGMEGAALAVTSHFFEFLDDSGNAFLAHQLTKGRTYSVVVTTGGGFYRYQLHDLIEVVGHFRQVPLMRFVGKTDNVSDLFGEKLDLGFVEEALARVFAAQGFAPLFSMLAPDERLDGACYTLYVEAKSNIDASALAEAVDGALRANFHYDYCRRLGQLGDVRVLQVERGAESYLRACQLRGQRLGNIKPRILQKTSGWEPFFTSRP